MNKTDPVWLRIQLNKVAWITGIWMLISMGQFFYEYAVYAQHDFIPQNFNFQTWFWLSLVRTFIAGVVGGSITVFFFEKWFRIMPYFKAFFSVLAIYSAVFLIVSYFAYSLLFRHNLEGSLTYTSSWANDFILSAEFIKNFIFWFLAIMMTTTGLQVNDKYGPGVLKQVLIGKYFKPRREERIFMFLDLRSSTFIAERLGEAAYFSFLKEVIEDITRPILYTRGEIYQYVGDEVVISWLLHKGKATTDCIHCYFEIQKVMSRKRPEYEEKYGLAPEFKAGLHYGHVLAGEIGVIKRDITYTGDTLNTASRIQNKCNELEVDILLSKQLLDKLSLAPHQYHPKRMGEIELRGKSEKVVLYTI
jgi:adenylate cyclase